MGQISVTILAVAGSNLSGNQHFAAVLWHGATVVLIVLTYGLWVLAKRRDLAFEIVLSGVQVGFAAVFLVYGLTRLGTVSDMPQWVIFLIIPALTRFGQSRERVL